MSSLNKVTLIGHLGRDPELKFIGDDSVPVCNFSMATSFKKKGGEEKTEWHRIVAWRKTAELCGEYLSKGRQCCIEGRLETRKWQDKEGNDRYTTEIVANNVVFLGSGADKKPKEESGGNAASQSAPPPADDVPF